MSLLNTDTNPLPPPPHPQLPHLTLITFLEALSSNPVILGVWALSWEFEEKHSVHNKIPSFLTSVEIKDSSQYPHNPCHLSQNEEQSPENLLRYLQNL